MDETLIRGALLGAGIAVAAALVIRHAMAWRRSRKARRRARHAVRGEVRAQKLLTRMGYEIIATQSSVVWPIAVDGEPMKTTLRADLLVRREGRVYVAEVKTGLQAPSIRNASTRRQLLEYFLAFAAEGLLLIDADQERVFEIGFPGLADSEPKNETTARRRPFGWLSAWFS